MNLVALVAVPDREAQMFQIFADFFLLLGQRVAHFLEPVAIFDIELLHPAASSRISGAAVLEECWQRIGLLHQPVRGNPNILGEIEP